MVGNQVLIKNCDGQEVCAWLAIKATANLYHPIGHFSAELGRNHVALQGVVDGGRGHVSRLVGRALSPILAAGVDKLARLECLLNIFELAAVEEATVFDIFRISTKLLDQVLRIGFLFLWRAVAFIRQGGGVFLDFFQGLRRRVDIERLLLCFLQFCVFL